MKDKKNKIFYQYCVSVCDLDRKDSFFIPIAYFSENEKDKVDALVELLKTHSHLKPEAVHVEQSYSCLLDIKFKKGSALAKNMERLMEERNKAFDEKKLLKAKPVEKKDKTADSKKAKRTPLPKVVKSNPPKVYTADGRKREWKAIGNDAVLFVDGVDSGYSEPFGNHRAAVEGAERLQEEDAD